MVLKQRTPNLHEFHYEKRRKRVQIKLLIKLYLQRNEDSARSELISNLI